MLEKIISDLKKRKFSILLGATTGLGLGIYLFYKGLNKEIMVQSVAMLDRAAPAMPLAEITVVKMFIVFITAFALLGYLIDKVLEGLFS